MIKVSVCVPVYGVEKYIERFARSLFEQTLADDVEFLFINDCTKDKSIEILRSVSADYPNRQSQIRIVEHQQNRGVSITRNTALDNARGEFIFFADPDDFLMPGALEKILETAQSNNADYVTAGMCIQYDDHKEYPQPLAYDRKADFLADMLARKIPCSIWNNLIRKTLFTANNIMFPETLNMGEDLSVTPRLIHFAEKVAFCPEVLYCYYRSNATSYCNTSKLKNLQDITQAYNILHDFFSTAQPPAPPELLRAMQTGNFIEMLWMAAANLDQLRWLKKNFKCRVWKLDKSQSARLKVANILFQLGLLRTIVWGTALLRRLR